MKDNLRQILRALVAQGHDHAAGHIHVLPSALPLCAASIIWRRGCVHSKNMTPTAATEFQRNICQKKWLNRYSMNPHSPGPASHIVKSQEVFLGSQIVVSCCKIVFCPACLDASPTFSTRSCGKHILSHLGYPPCRKCLNSCTHTFTML